MIVNYPIAYGSKYLLSAWGVIQKLLSTFSESVWIQKDLALLSLPFRSIGIIYNYLHDWFYIPGLQQITIHGYIINIYSNKKMIINMIINFWQPFFHGV
jgi:hypothetical protein